MIRAPRRRRPAWSTGEQPFDPGLQPERVALSWQRTALALAVGSLLYGRIVAGLLGAWALAPMMLGLALSAFVGWKSRTRYVHHHLTLTRHTGPIADGALPAVLAISVWAAGIFTLILVVVQAVNR